MTYFIVADVGGIFSKRNRSIDIFVVNQLNFIGRWNSVQVFFIHRH